MKTLNKKQVLGLVACAMALTAAPALAADDAPDAKQRGGMFQKHDTNGDGVISKAEFLSHAEERFANMDADGSGDLSKDEMKDARKKMHQKMKDLKDKRKAKKESE